MDQTNTTLVDGLVSKALKVFRRLPAIVRTPMQRQHHQMKLISYRPCYNILEENLQKKRGRMAMLMCVCVCVCVNECTLLLQLFANSFNVCFQSLYVLFTKPVITITNNIDFTS